MYDVVIVGAGPGGIFTAYELLEKRPDLKIAVFEMGKTKLEKEPKNKPNGTDFAEATDRIGVAE